MTTCTLCGAVIPPVLLKIPEADRAQMSQEQYLLSCLSSAFAQHVQQRHKEFALFAHRLSQQALGYTIASAMRHTGADAAAYNNSTKAEGELLILYLLKLPSTPSPEELQDLHDRFHAEVTQKAVAEVKAESDPFADPGFDDAPPDVIQ